MFEDLFANRGLSFDRLRALLEVQEAGSIAQAAPGDPVRQSQYSRQLRELAEFFNVSLTQRRGKELKLSPEGERLAGITRAHFQSLHDLRRECLQQEADYRLAAGDSLLQWLVIPRLPRERVAKLRVRFSTFNLRTHDIIAQLSDGRLDFGLVRADAVTADLESAPLGTLTYRLVVPRALVPAPRVSFRHALTSVPLVTQTGDGQFSQRLREIASEAGGELRPRLTCQSFPQSLAAVRGKGHGAVLPAIALHELPAAEVRVIDAPALRRLDRAMALAWHPRVLRLRGQASEVRNLLTRAFAI